VALTKLEWALSLTDRLTAPATRADRALAKLERRFEQVRRAQRRQEAQEQRNSARSLARMRRLAARHERAESRAQRAADAAQERARAAGVADRGEALGAMGTALGLVASLAAAAAGAVVRVGAAFATAAHDAIVFRERAMTTLRTVLQSDESARRVFADSQRIARLTPFDTSDVVEQRVRLVAADFTEDQSRVLQAALADVQALFGQSRAEILTSAFERIQNGGLTGEVLEELRNSRLGTGQIIRNLATAANITASNPDELQRRVLAAARQGRIANGTIIAEILNQVQRRTHADTLGAFARGRGGESFEGALSNLRSAFSDLLTSGEITELPGVRSLTRGLGRVSELMSDQSEVGRRLRTTLYSITSAAAGFVGRLLESGAAERALTVLVDVLQNIWERFNNMLPAAKAFFEGFSAGVGPLIQGFRALGGAQSDGAPTEDQVARWRSIGTAIGAVTTVVGTLASLLYGVGQVLVTLVGYPVRVAREAFVSLGTGIETLLNGGTLYDAGRNVIEGFIRGVQDAFAANIASIGNLFGSVATAARGALQIRSPSRIFEEIGEYTHEGFVIGLQGGAGASQEAMRGLVEPPATTVASMGEGRGGIGSLTIQVNGADAGGDPEALAALIAARVSALFDSTVPEQAT
jgi:hypothetical protein